VPTIWSKIAIGMAGTRSLSSGAHPRDPLALPTAQLNLIGYRAN
jgi:hypothetical protein